MYFGQDPAGRPVLLIRIHSASRARAPVQLNGLSVYFCLSSVISLPTGETQNGDFATLLCTSDERDLQQYFISVCSALVKLIGQATDSDSIIRCIQRSIDLYQKIALPQKKSVVGLAGELYAIYLSSSSLDMVNAWRNGKNDHFDFSIGDARLEVKGVSGRRRSHYFSLEQTNPPPGTYAVVLSLFIEAAGAGLSIGEMIRRIDARLFNAPELQMKFHEIIAGTLGSAITSAFAFSFDERQAKASARYFDLLTIPAIRIAPLGVTSVKFNSDLSTTPELDRSYLENFNLDLRKLTLQSRVLPINS